MDVVYYCAIVQFVMRHVFLSSRNRVLFSFLYPLLFTNSYIFKFECNRYD